MPAKKRDYFTDNDVNEPIPGVGHPPQDQDTEDLLTTLRTLALDVLDDDPRVSRSTLQDEHGEKAENVELDLTPGATEAASDPLRVYLREMGASPLLTREGEVLPNALSAGSYPR